MSSPAKPEACPSCGAPRHRLYLATGTEVPPQPTGPRFARVETAWACKLCGWRGEWTLSAHYPVREIPPAPPPPPPGPPPPPQAKSRAEIRALLTEEANS